MIQEIHTLGKKDTYENVRKATVQTEDLLISESPKESQADLKSKAYPENRAADAKWGELNPQQNGESSETSQNDEWHWHGSFCAKNWKI